MSKTTSLRLDARLEEHVSSDMLLLRRSPARKSKKGGAKGSVASLKESTLFGCVSQDSYPRKSVLRGEGKLGSKHAVKFSKGTWHQKEIRERKGPSQGVVYGCGPHERSPCAPKSEERSQQETLHQERCVRRVAWDLAKIFTSSRRDPSTLSYAARGARGNFLRRLWDIRSIR